MPDGTLRIGLIGLGLMGHGMGRNLVGKGFPLTVLGHRNRAPVEDLIARGATEAGSPAEMVAAVDVLFLCVTGSPQVESLFRRPDGILAGAGGNVMVVDCSTSEPASTLRLAAELAERGGTLVDAPLTRTPAEAQAGRLNTLVGGSDAVVAALRPVLGAFCENIFHAGPLGSGHTLKLISNFLVAGTVGLLAEALSTAARANIDGRTLYDVIVAGPLLSPLIERIVPKALDGQFDAVRFQLGNAQKDLRYYTHLTEELGVASFLGETVHQMFTQASAQGFRDHFIASMIEAVAKTHGVSLGQPSA